MRKYEKKPAHLLDFRQNMWYTSNEAETALSHRNATHWTDPQEELDTASGIFTTAVYGEVWFGLVGFDCVFGKVRFGVARHGVAWQGVAWPGRAWRDLAWLGLAKQSKRRKATQRATQQRVAKQGNAQQSKAKRSSATQSLTQSLQSVSMRSRETPEPAPGSFYVPTPEPAPWGCFMSRKEADLHLAPGLAATHPVGPGAHFRGTWGPIQLPPRKNFAQPCCP